MADSRDPRDARDHEVPVKVIDRRWWANPEESAGAGEVPEGQWRPGKPTYVEQLEAQLAEKDRQLQEVLAKYREASREFDEARARLRKDIGREIERGRRTMLAELLDVVDNLDRAIEAARSGPLPPTQVDLTAVGRDDSAPSESRTSESGSEALLQGVEMVRRLFLAKLDGFGIRRIDPLGEQFDPGRHEAITVVPTDEPSQEGVVRGVLAPGYLVGDEVLRPARVAVARHAESQP